jgi:NTE family protein
VITGASVGALVGAASANGRLANLEQWVCTLTQRDVWRLVDARFRGGGVMTGVRLMEAITGNIGDAPIESLPIAFGAVATDLYTGEEVWLRDGPFMAAVRASSGVPGLFSPSLHEGRWLIDGGVVNPVPVSLCRALGADLVIAVDLSRSVTKVAKRVGEQPATPRSVAVAPQTAPDSGRVAALTAEGMAILTKWSGLVDGLVESFRSKRTEPGLLEVMSSAVGIMQDRITRSRFAIDPADVVLRPDLADFQLMDFHRAREAIDIGAEYVGHMAQQLEPIVAVLQARSAG